MTRQREVWIDWLRVVACFLVMLTHSCEPFYFGGDGTLVLTASDAFWVAFLNAVPRVCVPLFVVASSYLLFPLRYSTGVFFRKRAVRVLIPFAVWTAVYAVASGDVVQYGKPLLLNFNYSSGHLWFVYMLLGLYLIMPMLSPWAERVGKRELRAYLCVWLFTTLIPLIRQAVGGEMPVVAGPSGIPNILKYPLWGECSWNSYGTFYYISGFVGYMLLGLYFRKFVGEVSWKKTWLVAVPAIVVGLLICSLGFLHNVYASSQGQFPYEAPLYVGALWEVAWLNDTIGVALMTVGWLMLFRKLKSSGKFYTRVLLPISQASYGMYLCHMFALSVVAAWVRAAWGVGPAGVMGVWTTPVEMLSIAVSSFVAVALLCVFLRRIPKLGTWMIG